MNRASRTYVAPIGVLAVLAALSACAPATAGAAVGQGVGTYTCGEAANAVRGDHELELMYFSWAQGWMTGWNLAQKSALQPTVDLNTQDVNEQRAFIKSYCANHPNGLYLDAVRKLYEVMGDIGQ